MNKKTTVKSLLIRATLVMSLLLNFHFVYLHFRPYLESVIIYSGNDNERIEEIVKILTLNNILYKISTKDYTIEQTAEKIKVISIDVQRINYEKASSFIVSEMK